MRMTALTAGLLVAAVFTVAGNSSSVKAQSQNNGQPQVNQTAPAQPPEPRLVEIKPGDYLAKIARENDTTHTRLFDANENVKDPDIIYPGEKLRIPRPDEQLISRSAPVETPAPAAPVAATKKPAAAPSARAPRPAAPRVAVSDGSVWDRLAQCESGGNWSINTGNGYYGGLQFSLSSWRGVGGTGYPHQASREEQIQRGIMLQARQGWGAWPACTAKLGIG